MPLIYQHQPDEAITWQKIAFDEEGGWWAGIQQCAASVAITAALVAASLSTAQAQQVYTYHQDAPGTVNLHVVPESDFWQNPVAPLPATLYQPLPYAPDIEQFPAGSLKAVPEEFFWQNPSAPIPASLFQVLPYGFDANEIVPLAASPLSPDEDFWPTLVAPSQLSFSQLYWFEGNEFVLQPFIPGEDLWQNPAPVAAPVWKSYMFTDAEDMPHVVIPPPTGAHYIPVFRRRRR